MELEEFSNGPVGRPSCVKDLKLSIHFLYIVRAARNPMVNAQFDLNIKPPPHI